MGQVIGETFDRNGCDLGYPRRHRDAQRFAPTHHCYKREKFLKRILVAAT
jgi:hypothetical protein